MAEGGGGGREPGQLGGSDVCVFSFSAVFVAAAWTGERPGSPWAYDSTVLQFLRAHKHTHTHTHTHTHIPARGILAAVDVVAQVDGGHLAPANLGGVEAWREDGSARILLQPNMTKKKIE